MAGRLPDIPIESWISDQQEQFQRQIGGLLPALEFEAAASERIGEIPADWPGTEYAVKEEDLLRQQQEQYAREEEQRRQQQEQTQREAAAAEQERVLQQQAQSQAASTASSLGIPTPDNFLSMLGNHAPTTGAFDQATGDSPATPLADSLAPVSPDGYASPYDLGSVAPISPAAGGGQQIAAADAPPDPYAYVREQPDRAPTRLENALSAGVGLATDIVNPMQFAAHLGVKAYEGAAPVIEGAKDSLVDWYNKEADAVKARQEAGIPGSAYTDPLTTDFTTPHSAFDPAEATRKQLPEETTAYDAGKKAASTLARAPFQTVEEVINKEAGIVGANRENLDVSRGYGEQFGIGKVGIGDVVANIAPTKWLEIPQWISVAADLVDNPVETAGGLAILGTIAKVFHANPKAGLAIVGGILGAADSYINSRDINQNSQYDLSDAALETVGAGIGTYAAVRGGPKSVKYAGKATIDGLKYIASRPTVEAAARSADEILGRLVGNFDTPIGEMRSGYSPETGRSDRVIPGMDRNIPEPPIPDAEISPLWFRDKAAAAGQSIQDKLYGPREHYEVYDPSSGTSVAHFNNPDNAQKFLDDYPHLDMEHIQGSRANPEILQDGERFQMLANRNPTTPAAAGGATGAVVGGVTGAAEGFNERPDDPYYQRLQRASDRALSGAMIGGAVGVPAGILGARKLTGFIVNEMNAGRISPATVFSTHPESVDRMKAIILLAARGYPDDAVVPIPGGVQLENLTHPGEEDVQTLYSRMSEGLTAGQIREQFGSTPAETIGKNVTRIISDFLTGSSQGIQQMSEARADEASVLGLRRPILVNSPKSDEFLRWSKGRSIAGAINDPQLGLLAPLDATRADDQVVLRVLQRISEQNGVADPNVLIAVDARNINAFGQHGTGASPDITITKPLYDRLLDLYRTTGDDSAIEALLLHEMSHATDDDLGKTLLMKGVDYLRNLNTRVVGKENPVLSRVMEVPQSPGTPKRGQWFDRLQAGAGDVSAEAQAHYDEAMRKISESNAARGVAKKIRLKSQANAAWGKYEQLAATETRVDTGATEAGLSRPIESPGTDRLVPGPEQPGNVREVLPTPETGAQLSDTGLASAERMVPENVSGSGAGGVLPPESPGAGVTNDLLPDSSLLPETIDPQASVSRDQQRQFFGGLFTDYSGDRETADLVSRAMVKMERASREGKPIRMAHLQTILEQLGARKPVDLYGEHATPTEYADTWLRTNEFLAPNERSRAVQDTWTPTAGSTTPHPLTEADTQLPQRTPEEQAQMDRLRAERDRQIAGEQPVDVEDVTIPESLIEHLQFIPENSAGNPSFPKAASQGQKLLDKLEREGWDVQDARDAFDEFVGAKRPDYADAEEFRDEKSNLWDEFYGRLQEATRPGTAADVAPETGTAGHQFSGAAAGGLAGSLTGDPNDDSNETPIQNVIAGTVLGGLFGRKKLNPKLVGNRILDNDPVIKMYANPTRGGQNKATLKLSEAVHDAWRNKIVPLITDEVAALQGFQNDMGAVWHKAMGTPLPAEVLAAELKRFDPMRASEMAVNEHIKPVLQGLEELGVPREQFEAWLTYQHNIDIAEAQGRFQNQNPNTGSYQSPSRGGQPVWVPNSARDFPGSGNLGSTWQDAHLGINGIRGEWMIAGINLHRIDMLAQKVWDHGDRLLQMKRDAGLIDAQTYQDLRTAFPHYIPTKILEHLSDDERVAVNKSMSVTSNLLQELTKSGTKKESMEIMASLIGATRETYAAAHKNTIFNKFVDLFDLASAGQHQLGSALNVSLPGYDPMKPVGDVQRRVARYADGITPWNNNGKPPEGYVTVQGFRNGVKTRLAVNKDLGDVTAYASPLIIPVISGVMSAFRAGATSRNPMFLSANLMLDLASYMVRETARNNGDPITPFVEWAKTAYEFLPVGTMTGGIAGGYAGAQTINEDDPNWERFAKVGGGMLVGGAVGAGIDKTLPFRGNQIWGDIIHNEFRGDMKRFLEQGGGTAGAYYSKQGKAPEPTRIEGVGPKFDELRRKLDIKQRGELQQDVKELTRGMIDMSSPREALRTLRDTVLLKPVEKLGERIELVPRVASMRMVERRSAGNIQALRGEVGALQAFTNNGTALPAQYALPTGQPVRSLQDAEAALSDAQERLKIEGTQGGRTTTIDFNKGGTWSKFVNQMVPFFNVGVQSMADLQRAYAEKPKSFPATIAGAVIGPAIATEVWNNADSQRAADYADVPQYIKDQGLVIMLDRATHPPVVDDQGNEHPQFFHFRFRQLAPFANATREILQRTVYAGSPSDANRRSLAEALFSGGLAPVLPVSVSSPTDLAMNFAPPVVSTAIQLGTNLDTFRDARIESTKGDERASPLSKGLASAFGGRPSQWQFGTSDLGTGMAGVAHGASQIFSDKPPQGPASTPFVGGITGRWIKGSIGEGAQQATTHLVTPSAEKLLTDNGIKWRPAIAPPEIDGVQLSRQEQARYQRSINEETDNAIQIALRNPEVQKLPPLLRDEYVQKRVNARRDVVRSQFKASLGEKEWTRRYTEAITAKRGG